MPLIRLTCDSDEDYSFIEDMQRRKSQADANSTRSAVTEEGNSFSITKNEGKEDSHLATFRSNYENIPDYLKRCFDYICCVFRFTDKGKMVRLLVAEGLIPEKTNNIMEDTGANIITDLISLGMLRNGDRGLKIHRLYRQFSLIKVEKQAFVETANSPLVVVIKDKGKGINPKLKSLNIKSLFVIAEPVPSSSPFESSPRGKISRSSMEIICGLHCLLVLDLDGEVECLPDEVGNLVHLRYLGLENSDLDEIPKTLGNLQNLQTLDIRMCRSLQQLPLEVTNIQKLRHLLMSKSCDDGEIRVPKEITKLKNLITLTGVYAGGGIANELSKLILLRELGVKRLSADHAVELFAAIMKMENLVSLSLEVEGNYYSDEDDESHYSFFPAEFEEFSPPFLLQELELVGRLYETPIWLASTSNLISLTLSFSGLLESPTLVLQFLPKLKNLSLWEAYRTTYIGKEFCEAGGFPELETLTISSRALVDWSEIENGAFPKLQSLDIRCFELRFLPEGLQNITTLTELSLLDIHVDLARRLKGDENYKINHIFKLRASCRYGNLPGTCYAGDPQSVLECI